MSLITISGVGKDFGPHTVLTEVTAAVARGEKIGIVGKNGGGKSTLLKCLLGLETPDRGSIRIARGLHIGYLAQSAQVDPSRTVRDEALTALASLQGAEEDLRTAERALAESPTDEDLLDAYGAARDRFDFAGGEGAADSLLLSLSAMGFSEADLEKPVGVLSGGETTRLAMAKLLATAPDVLALDEPTNHLDIRAVEWLESFLPRFPGAVLLVSHDRRFLENVAKTIWDVEDGRLLVYTGGYAAYREKRAAQRARQQEDYERQQAEIARTEEYIRRNIAGQNTRNAQGRRKQLARVERIERVGDEPAAMKAKLASSGRSGLDVVVAERATKSYGEKKILNGATFTLRRGDRVGVVGPNGVGKSTLIECLLGEEPLDAGFLRRGHGVTFAVHTQDIDDFDDDAIVLDEFYRRAGLTIAEARSHLARFLFSGDDVFKPVGALSGGERAKLRMALMVLSPANLLILDEPTNHLDVYSCDALTDALERFDGTLLVVSHDRALLDAATDKTLAMEGDGQVTLFDGNYAAYRRAKDAGELPSGPATGERAQKTSPIAAEPVGLSAHQLSKERARAQKKVGDIEAEIERLEQRLAELETKLASPTDDGVRLSREYGAVQSDLSAQVEAWADAFADAEKLGV